VRKDLKKAVEHMDVSLSHMKKVSEDSNIPREVRKKVDDIMESFSGYKNDINKIREMHI